MKKILIAFVLLTIITTTATACGDKSGNKAIRQSDRTPVTTDITTDITTPATTKNASPAPSNVELRPNPLIVPDETTPGSLPAETIPAETLPLETATPAQQTSPVPPAPQTETPEEFERQESANQQAIKEKREREERELSEANQNLLEEMQRADPALADEFSDWLYNLPTAPPTPEPRTPIDPENSRPYDKSELEFRIETNGEATLVKFTPDPTVENGKPVREVVVPDVYDYFDPINQTFTAYKVTSIAQYAFYNCDDLYSVVLGINIHTIGEFAFSECDNLEALTIPRINVDIAGNTFSKNSPKISLIARKYSDAETLAIKDRIPFTEYNS
jgi:hypothetical protein